MTSRLGTNLGRKRATRLEKERILIVSEGVITEPEYFKGLSRHLKQSGVYVFGVNTVGVGRDPEAVVERAIQVLSEDQAQHRRDRFDSAWCVFDVDRHKRLAHAVKRARQNHIEVAVSNPCFEIWLLWHYETHNGQISAAQLRRKLRDYGHSGKQIPANFAYSNAEIAKQRATFCNGVPDNPGTGVVSLYQHLRGGKNRIHQTKA